MSRPSLAVLFLIGVILFSAGSVMILRLLLGVPDLTDPELEQRQAAILASGRGILVFLYYVAVASGAVLASTSLTALFLRSRR